MFKLKTETSLVRKLCDLIIEWDETNSTTGQRTVAHSSGLNGRHESNKWVPEVPECEECGKTPALRCDYCGKFYCEEHLTQHLAQERRHENLAEDASRIWKKRRRETDV